MPYKNPEDARIRQHTYTDAHRKEKRAYMDVYRATRREEARFYAAAYRDTIPGILSAAKHDVKRIAKMRGMG